MYATDINLKTGIAIATGYASEKSARFTLYAKRKAMGLPDGIYSFNINQKFTDAAEGLYVYDLHNVVVGWLGTAFTKPDKEYLQAIKEI